MARINNCVCLGRLKCGTALDGVSEFMTAHLQQVSYSGVNKIYSTHVQHLV